METKKLKQLIVISFLITLVWWSLAGCHCPLEKSSKDYLSDIGKHRDYKIDPSKKFKAVTLRDVVSKPVEYKGLDILFSAVFHKYEDVFVPFYTQFAPEEYISFSIWIPEAKVWDIAERKKDIPFIYVKKPNPYITDFLNIKEYTPIEICGIVQSDFNGYPWIEASYIKTLGNPLYTKETLYHMITGFDETIQEKDTSAIEHLKTALSLNPPPEAETAIRTHIAVISERGKDYITTREQYEWLTKKHPDNLFYKLAYENANRLCTTIGPVETPIPQNQESLLKQLEEAKKQIENLKVLADLLEEQKNELKLEKETLSKDLDSIKNQLQIKNDELDKLIKEKDTLTNENKGLKETLQNRDTEITDLKKAIDETKNENQTLKSKLAEEAKGLQEEIDKLSKDKETLSKDLESAKNELEIKNKEMDSTKNQLQAKNTELETSSQKVKDLTSNLEKLIQEQKEFSKNNAQIVEELKKNLTNTNDAFENEKKARELDQKTIQEKDANIKELSEKSATLQDTIKSLNEELTKATESLKDLEDVVKLKNQIVELEAKSKELEDKNKELSEKVTQLEKEKAELSSLKDIQQTKEKIKQLEDTIRSLQKEIKELIEEREKEKE